MLPHRDMVGCSKIKTLYTLGKKREEKKRCYLKQPT